MTRNRRGLTLIELLIAMLITALTVSTIYMTLNVSMRTFKDGEASMDLYQSARTGMEKFAAELRGALSPESFWRRRMLHGGEARKSRTLTEVMNENQQDEQRNETIIFKGSPSTVTLVRVEANRRLDPPYDLRECEYKVDENKHQLVRVSNKSALAEQMAAWRAQRFPDEEDAYYSQFLAEAQSNVQERREVITDRVTRLTLKYFDGETWKDTWDSEQILTPEGVNPDEVTYAPGERPVRLGLPAAVEIHLTFDKDREFYTITDIPGSLLDLIPHKGTGKAIARGGVRYSPERGRRGGGIGGSLLPEMQPPPRKYYDPTTHKYRTIPGLPGQETRFGR